LYRGDPALVAADEIMAEKQKPQLIAWLAFAPFLPARWCVAPTRHVVLVLELPRL